MAFRASSAAARFVLGQGAENGGKLSGDFVSATTFCTEFHTELSGDLPALLPDGIDLLIKGLLSDLLTCSGADGLEPFESPLEVFHLSAE